MLEIVFCGERSMNACITAIISQSEPIRRQRERLTSMSQSVTTSLTRFIQLCPTSLKKLGLHKVGCVSISKND